jgi:copper transport protein
LRRLIGHEVALAVIVLGLTAVLVNLQPARSAAGVTGPFIKNVALGPYDLEVLVDPNEVGENQVHLTATDDKGRPAQIKEETVLFRMPEQDIGPLEAKGRRLAPGHFVVQGHQLAVEGTWQLEIVARTDKFNEERATVSIEVND